MFPWIRTTAACSCLVKVIAPLAAGSHYNYYMKQTDTVFFPRDFFSFIKLPFPSSCTRNSAMVTVKAPLPLLQMNAYSLTTPKTLVGFGLTLRFSDRSPSAKKVCWLSGLHAIDFCHSFRNKVVYLRKQLQAAEQLPSEVSYSFCTK